ncbi:hypothetical protein M0802_001447 [Mischocyttarus mexicanus]|nr:hypothetical protein M0802_001447 [Mischocyttarus mexicanus]
MKVEGTRKSGEYGGGGDAKTRTFRKIQDFGSRKLRTLCQVALNLVSGKLVLFSGSHQGSFRISLKWVCRDTHFTRLKRRVKGKALNAKTF